MFLRGQRRMRASGGPCSWTGSAGGFAVNWSRWAGVAVCAVLLMGAVDAVIIAVTVL